jgi:hypothetical protein
MARLRQRYRVGDVVRLNEDALDNYGSRWEDREFVVSDVSTRYMPSREWIARGRPRGYHPGFDDSSGSALYDLDGFPGSVYDWELE